ncbi:polysaccharide deacetylase family protein [Corynebacterium heidelbergense]|uniref:Polysaccharide deacetylase n=1 Tax=Corynebacterium heidelbergense TaxID=2055947 RepID=A0A364VAK3_9CORY|nr:polysaccharide deacetylase family protein [Corynebacterium heidelbergense]RAV33596.1 polysaccharide deacetylase [Corynebacterium heidelbergense]
MAHTRQGGTPVDRRLSRRELLGLGVLGAAGLVGGSAVLQGCSTQGEGRGTPTATTTAQPGPPSSGSSAPDAPSGSPQPDAEAEIQRTLAPLRQQQPTQWGTALADVTRRLDSGRPAATLYLTRDACGGPSGSDYDAELIDVLREHAVPATLFLNSRWVTANPEFTRKLIADPLFQVENHGTSHRPLSVNGRSAYGIEGIANFDAAVEEIRGNERSLREAFNHNISWFRSGTAHYDDVAVSICRALGHRVAGFGTNVDSGATASAADVRRALLGADAGDICIAHMNHPGSGTAAGLRRALPELLDRKTSFAKLG